MIDRLRNMYAGSVRTPEGAAGGGPMVGPLERLKNLMKEPQADTNTPAAPGRSTGISQKRQTSTTSSVPPLEQFISRHEAAPLTGAVSQESLDDYFGKASPFRVKENGRERFVSASEATKFLESYLSEKGYLTGTIQHILATHIKPLAWEINAISKSLKADETIAEEEKNALMKARSLYSGSLQLTISSLVQHPEVFEISPATVAPEPVTADTVMQRLHDQDQLWANPLVNNGEHLPVTEMRTLLSTIITDVYQPQDEKQRVLVGHLIKTYGEPLAHAYAKASRMQPEQSAKDKKLQRQAAIEESITLFIRDITSEKGGNKYLEAMEQASTAGLPEKLQEFFLKVALRAPVFYGHEQKDERREWARQFAARLDPAELAVIVDAIKYPDEDLPNPWEDDLGVRPLLVVKAIIERQIREGMRDSGMAADELDKRIRQFFLDEVQPLFQTIAETAKKVTAARAGHAQGESVKDLQVTIQAAYGQISTGVKRATVMPKHYFATHPLRNELGEEKEFDVNIDDQMSDGDLDQFLDFDTNRIEDEVVRKKAFENFARAHRVYISRLIEGFGANAAAQIVESASYKAWEEALALIQETIEFKPFSDEIMSILLAALEEFMLAEGTLEDEVAAQYSLGESDE